jgi:DNA-binding NarL/FixJ family response regulator
LNGIEAARQIRVIIPRSQIIFMSQESSADVVTEALSFGTRGYVLNVSGRNDLPAAVEAVLGGWQFVSRGLITNKPS